MSTSPPRPVPHEEPASGRARRGARAPVVATVDGFEHLHAAHCESGVTSTLFADSGMPLAEPLVFGIGGGLFFAHFSFVRVMGQPLTTFRSFPGGIFKGACRRLGVRYVRESFARPEAGMRRLDALLDEGRRVGLQLNIFWLPYIPRPMRIHFNGHNLVVLERRGDVYIVSDPVMEDLFECPVEALRRARFTGNGRLLSRGLLYYPVHTPTDLEDRLRPAVEQSLAHTCNRMLRIPSVFPYFGARGIGHLARRLPRWSRQGERGAREWVAGLVRVQEEIGTGGAGFRYLYAAFLQQAGERLGWAALAGLSAQTTAVGDRWRQFALQASRFARGKADVDLAQLHDILLDLEVAERELFQELDRVRLGGPPRLEG